MSWPILGLLALVMVGVGFLGGVYLTPSTQSRHVYSGPLLNRSIEFSFKADSRDAGLLRSGWHPPSRDCTWSSGHASIALKQIGSGPSGLKLALVAEGLVNDRRPSQDVELHIGSTKVAQWNWTKGGTRREVTAHVPQKLLTPDGDLAIVLIDTNVKSIRDLGLGDGTSPHGICLVRLVVTPM